MKLTIGSLISVAACALCIGLPTAVGASAITNTYSFTASNFPQSSPPVSSVSGSFTLTFDPTLPVNAGSLDAISLSIAGHSYTTAEVGFLSTGSGVLDVGGLVTGISGLGTNTNDFSLTLRIDSVGVPGVAVFGFAVAGFAGIFGNGGTVSASVQNGVPEPATLALLSLGLAGLGFARRKTH